MKFLELDNQLVCQVLLGMCVHTLFAQTGHNSLFFIIFVDTCRHGDVRLVGGLSAREDDHAE